MMLKRVVWMWQLSYAGRLTFVWFLELVSVTFQCLAGPRQGHGISVRNHTSLIHTTCKLRNQQEPNFTKGFRAKTLVSIKKKLVLQMISRFCLRKLYGCNSESFNFICNSYEMQKTITTNVQFFLKCIL